MVIVVRTLFGRLGDRISSSSAASRAPSCSRSHLAHPPLMGER